MGDFLVSSSYDTNASIWACPGFLPIKTLPHQGKLMSLDVSAKGDLIATTSYDRTVHIWGPEETVKEDPSEVFKPTTTPAKDDLTKAEPMDDE